MCPISTSLPHSLDLRSRLEMVSATLDPLCALCMNCYDDSYGAVLMAGVELCQRKLKLSSKLGPIWRITNPLRAPIRWFQNMCAQKWRILSTGCSMIHLSKVAHFIHRLLDDPPVQNGHILSTGCSMIRRFKWAHFYPPAAR